MQDQLQRYLVTFSFTVEKKDGDTNTVSGSREVVVPEGMDVNTFIKQDFANGIIEAITSAD